MKRGGRGWGGWKGTQVIWGSGYRCQNRFLQLGDDICSLMKRARGGRGWGGWKGIQVIWGSGYRTVGFSYEERWHLIRKGLGRIERLVSRWIEEVGTEPLPSASRRFTAWWREVQGVGVDGKVFRWFGKVGTEPLASAGRRFAAWWREVKEVGKDGKVFRWIWVVCADPLASIHSVLNCWWLEIKTHKKLTMNDF